MFYAKPSGTYAISSVEGTANIKAVYNYLHPLGYTDNCIVGILGNVMAESGLNPWLWENNTYNPNNGYGLFQFTPGSEYINASWIPDYAPNTDPSQAVAGASPNDALGQLYAFSNDTFAKWYGYCWRSYWSQGSYPDLYNDVQRILATYGSGGVLSMADFMTITDYHDACLAFMGCYEGPLIPNFATRDTYADQIKPIIDGHSGLMNILFLKKIIDNQFKIW